MDEQMNYRLLFDRFAKVGERFDQDWKEGIVEKIRGEGDRIARCEWDSGGPGAGAGMDYVYKYRELYFADNDAGTYGPFESFTEAAEVIGLFTENEATTEVWIDSDYRTEKTEKR